MHKNVDSSIIFSLAKEKTTNRANNMQATLSTCIVHCTTTTETDRPLRCRPPDKNVPTAPENVVSGQCPASEASDALQTVVAMKEEFRVSCLASATSPKSAKSNGQLRQNCAGSSHWTNSTEAHLPFDQSWIITRIINRQPDRVQ